MPDPTWKELQPNKKNNLMNIKDKANLAGYNLLVKMNSKSDWEKNTYLQIATSESLTAGLIMSTLVDIPWGGYLKYGCTGVYDTDAKRVFNGVKVDDVYTNRCAKEMAVGLLNNSNATIAVAVTGNAMPDPKDAEKLGEVFIGIAGYNKKGDIIYITKSVNACLKTENKSFSTLCKKWYETVKKGMYNPRSKTALISQEIRNYVVYAALTECVKFIDKNNPIVPDFIIKRKAKNNKISKGTCTHDHIPSNKYNTKGKVICVDKCVNTNTCNRVNTREFHIKKSKKK